jgi:pimeloyl-ACP methyl ester carboxylesterase
MASEEMISDHYHDGPGGKFHVIDWGRSGPLAHLAHATGLCAAIYSPFVRLLGRQMHVVGMDDRGHGKTTAPADIRSLHNWDVFADDLQSLLGTYQEPAIAMGHSRGAVASMLLALRQPTRIQALVLIDPTILPFSIMWFVYLAKLTRLNRYYPIAARAAKRNAVWPDRKTIHTAYQSKKMFQTWQKGFLEGYIQDGTRETPDGRIRLSCDPRWEARCFSVYPHNLWRHIPKIQQPVLVIYGEKSDTFVSRAANRFQAKVPHAQMRCFKGTSHFVPMEKPEETAEAIVAFVSNLSGLS